MRPDAFIRQSIVRKGSALAGRALTVAVVDDNPSMLRSIQRLLNAEGFPVETFPSAEAFLDADGASRAACVVLDIHLTGISGLELRRRLTTTNSGPPIIFITAIGDEALKAAAMQLGCAAYLQKPFAPEALVAAVAKALAAARPV